MHLPRYWAREHGIPPGGRPPRVDVWGWSDVSEAEARLVARRRLAEVVARAESAGGLSRSAQYYPRVPLREPVVDEVNDAAGGLLALITRNRYGAEVLNTERVLVADIDVPEWEDREPGSPGGLFRRRIRSVEESVERIAPVLSRSDLAWRVYRTRAGLRVLAAGEDLAPGSDRARRLLAALEADPLYVRLSETYESYRARLSPKPWRIGLAAMPTTARRPERGTVVDVDRSWLSEYDRVSSGFAVCQLVTEGGSGMDDATRRLVRLHDRRTCAHASDIRLA